MEKQVQPITIPRVYQKAKEPNLLIAIFGIILFVCGLIRFLKISSIRGPEQELAGQSEGGVLLLWGFLSLMLICSMALVAYFQKRPSSTSRIEEKQKGPHWLISIGLLNTICFAVIWGLATKQKEVQEVSGLEVAAGAHSVGIFWYSLAISLIFLLAILSYKAKLSWPPLLFVFSLWFIGIFLVVDFPLFLLDTSKLWWRSYLMLVAAFFALGFVVWELRKGLSNAELKQLLVFPVLGFLALSHRWIFWGLLWIACQMVWLSKGIASGASVIFVADLLPFCLVFWLIGLSAHWSLRAGASSMRTVRGLFVISIFLDLSVAVLIFDLQSFSIALSNALFVIFLFFWFNKRLA